MNNLNVSLYLVTDSTYHTEESFLRTVEDACKGGVTLVQLREKNTGGRDYLEKACKVREIVEAARKAYQDGADYLGVGAIYPTTTKVTTVLTEVSTLSAICKAVPIPVVAIGGLNLSNLDILKGSGADGIAVVSAIMKAENPRKAAEELLMEVKQL